MANLYLDSVSVNFPIYNFDARSVKKKFLKISTGGSLSSNDNMVIVKALHNITFHLKHGDRVGLIGHNGSGKSTLLRVLAGIYEPSLGCIYSEGMVSPLLDIMLGVNQESTGYENILMRGLLLGLKRKQIRDKFNEIAEFTELGEYLYAPVRTYSAGMQLRLAFAVAICIEPDILLMDEMIEVGDASFVKKAKRYLENFIDRSSILVLASHSNETIQKFCSKVIWLENGRCRFFGPVAEGIANYQKLCKL